MFLKNIFRKNKKILGRGESGKGKTCGRGNKGQKSRSGKKFSNDFEGGQTRFFKKFPKFGFKSFKKKCFSLNIFYLNKIPFTFISLKFLKIFNIFNKKFLFIKIFSFLFYTRKIIFYNIFLSTLNIFFLNFNYFFIL